jgi:four helix bundle protein
MTSSELEERLIDFAVLILRIVKLLPNDDAGKVLKHQLAKSGTSPALNYGEARSAESKRDFIHKVKIVNKELRETHINLRIIKKSEMLVNSVLDDGINEANELVSIFTATIKTSSKD